RRFAIIERCGRHGCAPSCASAPSPGTSSMTLHDFSHPHLVVSVCLGAAPSDDASPSAPADLEGRAWLRVFVDAAAVPDALPHAVASTPVWAVADVKLAVGNGAQPGGADQSPPGVPTAAFSNLGLALDWLEAMAFTPRGLLLDRDAVASLVAGLCWRLES